MTLSQAKRKEAEELLALVCEMQTEFWETIHELEICLGIDIDDSSIDLTGQTVDSLLGGE